MNAPFDPVSFIHRLEAEGIARGAAEAIAQGIEDRNRELATRADVEKLGDQIDRFRHDMATKADKADLERYATKEELRTGLARQVVQIGGMLAGAIALIVGILGTIIALR